MDSNLTCMICGGDNKEELLVKGKYKVTRCTNCGLVFVQPHPSSQELQRLYSRDYFEEEHYPGGYWACRETTRRELLRILRRIEELSGGKGRILDVGCGLGYFAKLAQDSGWEVRGTEISLYAAKEAQKRLGTDVIFGGDLVEAEYADDWFDAVVFLDVLEHVTNPLAQVGEAYRITRPGGIVAITTPNVGSKRAKGSLESWPYLAVPEHLYLFSPATVKRILESAGFEVVTINKAGGLGVLAQQQGRGCRWGARMISKSPGLVSWSKSLTAVLARLFSEGDQLVVLARKMNRVNEFRR